MKTKILVLLTLLLIPLGVQAQSYQFFTLGPDAGLSDKFTYTMNQDPRGFLWVGTGQGLCRFDGKVFDTDFRGDSIPGGIAFSSLLDSRGRLWFGHEDGILSMLEGGSFRVFYPGEGTASSVYAIREDMQGNILALMQQGSLLVISPDLEVRRIGGGAGEEGGPFSGMFLNDFNITPDGSLLMGSNDGLTLFAYDGTTDSYAMTGEITELKYLVIQEIVAAGREGEYWIGTEDEGLYRLVGEGPDPASYSIEKLGADLGLAYARVTSIVFDGTRQVWITDYSKGVHRCELDPQGNLVGSTLFDLEKGIPDAYINQVFIDEEGNQWFSSQGNGIAVLRDQAFTFFGPWEDERETDVSAVITRGEDHWFGGNAMLAHYRGEHPGDFRILDRSNGLPNDRVSALYLNREGDLFIGTERSGLHMKEAGSDRIRPLVVSGNSLENIVNAIDGNGDSIFVATNNGVFTLNLKTGNRTSFTTLSGLPHNKINDVLVDSRGTAWLAMLASGLVGITPDNSIARRFLEGKPKLELTTLAEDERGTIWAGSYGDGVFSFDDSLSHYRESSGLMNDYTYSVAPDAKGFIWIGHREGMSRIDPLKGSVRVFGKSSGFSADFNRNAVVSTPGGRLLFGTTDGVIRYDAFQAREDTIAPRLSLKSVVISDTPHDPTRAIRLKYGKYKIRIDFVGINLSNPEAVTYQYMLDGHEEEWVEAGNMAYAFYSRVEDGNYTFRLRACDANGNCSTEPLELQISVKIPIWKAWWFILSSFLLVLGTVFVVFKIRERNQKAIQEYLQRQLDERTREVVQQKEEIEIKNRDITDSINYAQRIQASILPPIKKLHDAFSGSFVFYQPRDIVSGDFYWYEKVDDDRFLVVCADSTGHGVPGAFMSMIGTTLIKDICLRSGIQKPSEVLTTLDNEVRESLNQNQEASGSNDGMDIIVAEINMRTLKFTVSSAMRPVIIYSGEEQIYVKGSRSSIGGQLDEDRQEKEFIDQEYQLKRGDIIYMFSDGYPDQFGGPLGRKFKMVRLKNLLRDIHDKPMDEQYNYIKSNFFLWKEDLEQVDDVLFMGIRI